MQDCSKDALRDGWLDNSEVSEPRYGMTVSNRAGCILSDETESKNSPPAVDVHIVPDKACSGVSFVVTNDSGW